MDELFRKILSGKERDYVSPKRTIYNSKPVLLLYRISNHQFLFCFSFNEPYQFLIFNLSY